MLIVLSLGSNCGDRSQSIGNAISWLSRIYRVVAKSSIYETEAIGGGDKTYLNSVVCIDYDQSIDILTADLKRFEVDNGRTIEKREKGEVPIDIDIVMAGDKIVRPRDFACGFFKIGYSAIKDAIDQYLAALR